MRTIKIERIPYTRPRPWAPDEVPKYRLLLGIGHHDNAPQAHSLTVDELYALGKMCIEAAIGGMNAQERSEVIGN